MVVGLVIRIYNNGYVTINNNNRVESWLLYLDIYDHSDWRGVEMVEI